MKTLLSALLVLCIFAGSAWGQGLYGVHGTVIDSAISKTLKMSTVCVLNAKDSTLVQFTRAAADGSFVLNHISRGKYILLITYPAYADYVERFALDSAKQHINFGSISLTLKEKLLREVIIKAKAAAVKINGDTTEYNAKAFVVQPNARVEDLLKQMPGIQVDKDGKITAQGETVTKVLVDGEEFFGDDPTLVTKNIRADMVDKVQLYDKKSDQATFTGIDDGKHTKTINIKLKDDKKVGYFGKLEAGAGNSGFYEGQGMYNYFKDKLKFATYSTMANDGKTGLSNQDDQKYGNNGYGGIDDGGLFSGSMNQRDELDSYDGSYGGQGIPQSATGGAHFDKKWNKDKETLNENIKAGYLQVKGAENDITQNNYSTGVVNSSSNQVYDKFIFRQHADIMYSVKIDTTQNLKFNADATNKHSNNNTTYTAGSQRADSSLLNNSFRTINNTGQAQVFNMAAFYSKKFKKRARTLSDAFSIAYNHADAHGNLYARNKYYNTQSVITTDTVTDEYKTSYNTSIGIINNFTYTDRIIPHWFITSNYGLGLNNGSSNLQSFNKSASGNYDLPDNTLTNYYQLNQFTNQQGAVISFRGVKALFSFGSKVSEVRFKQLDIRADTAFVRNFISLAPQANYQYKFSQQSTLNISYAGTSHQPGISQIQPLRNNTDPLNISIGNPGLQPSFGNRFSFNYNAYKVLSSRSVYISGVYNFTSNQIIGSTLRDSTTGKSVYQAVNLGNKRPGYHNFYINYGRKISLADLYLSGSVSVNGYNTYSYFNGALIGTTSNSYSFNFNLSKSIEKVMDFYLYGGPSYDVKYFKTEGNYIAGQAKAPAMVNNNSWNFNGYTAISLYLPKQFLFGATGNYNYTGPSASFNQSFNKLIINCNVGKTFFKDESLKLNLTVNDLLNQNSGIYRSSNSNTISQTSYTTIKRYVMFTLSWDFNKMGGTATSTKTN